VWKLNHYYERLDEFDRAHGLPPANPFAPPPAEPAWELHNLTADPEERRNRAADAEDDQQQPPGHDRRQRQRQMHQRAHDGAAGEAGARQHPGGQHGNGQPEADGACRHRERQPDCFPLIRRQGQVIRP